MDSDTTKYNALKRISEFYDEPSVSITHGEHKLTRRSLHDSPATIFTYCSRAVLHVVVNNKI